LNQSNDKRKNSSTAHLIEGNQNNINFNKKGEVGEKIEDDNSRRTSSTAFANNTSKLSKIYNNFK